MAAAVPAAIQSARFGARPASDSSPAAFCRELGRAAGVRRALFLDDDLCRLRAKVCPFGWGFSSFSCPSLSPSMTELAAFSETDPALYLRNVQKSPAIGHPTL